MRGIGDSSHPDDGYDMATVADDLAELMTLLGHEVLHVGRTGVLRLIRLRRGIPREF
jgi:hypothetical protein